jgi:hypothetical protein
MMWLLPSSSRFELTDLCCECVHPTTEQAFQPLKTRLFANEVT